MPYMLEGNCVYKKNPDGSKGKSMGCSETHEMAKKHLQALYANESKALSEFSMRITKATIPDSGKKNRVMRLSMVTSDTGEDAYEERMSTDLYNDFIERINNDLPVPETFQVICEEGWNGGMPYQSISHYRSGGGKNVPGSVEKVYVDGDLLKANTVLDETPLGLAVWKAVCQDVEDRAKPLEERAFENPVRISIGFLDLAHKHILDDGGEVLFIRNSLEDRCEACSNGVNGKVYLKGQLVHLAYTRKPANPRTSVEVFRMDDEITTREEDARSIIGDLADELVDKSLVSNALVVKAEEESRDQKKKEKEEEVEEEKSQALPEPTQTEEVMEPTEVVEPVAVQEPVQKSALDLAVEAFKSKVMENKGKGAEALKALQPLLDNLVNVTKAEVANPVEDQVEITRAAVREEVAVALKEALPEIMAQIMKSMPASQGTALVQETPKPRSLVVERAAPSAQKSQLTQIEQLARQFTFGSGQPQ